MLEDLTTISVAGDFAGVFLGLDLCNVPCGVQVHTGGSYIYQVQGRVLRAGHKPHAIEIDDRFVVARANKSSV